MGHHGAGEDGAAAGQMPQAAALEVKQAVATVLPCDGGEPLGSAWLIGEGLALTAAHVVVGSQSVELAFENGEKLRASVVDQNEAFDVALLELADTRGAARRSGLTMNDDGEASVGAPMRCCGFPKGWDYEYYGVAATLNSAVETHEGARVMALATSNDRKALRGLSGGPVVDLSGAAVGVVIHFPTGLSGVVHATRLDDAWRVLPQWRARQPHWRSAGPISRHLSAKEVEWGRLPQFGPLRGKAQPLLADVFVSQRFRVPARTGEKADSRVPERVGALERLLSEIRKQGRSVVLRGDAGSGKSVLLRRLASALAAEWLGHEQRTHIPGLIQASDLVDRSVDDAISAAWPDLHASHFRSMPVLLVDGLDEIADTEERRRVVERLKHRVAEARRSAAPPLRIVLASRPLALLDEITAADAAQFVVQPWTGAQLETFAQRWFRDDARAQSFLDALDQAHLGDLAVVPALATVAAVVFERSPDGRLPSSRSVLYDRFVEYSLMARGSEARARLGELAKELYPGRGAALIDQLWGARDALLEHTADEAQRGRIPRAGAYVDAASAWCRDNGRLDLEDEGSFREDLQHALVEELLLSTGVFGPTPEGLGFVHNTVREALVARKIARTQPRDADEVWAVVRRWVEPRWREIVLLTLARWSQSASLRPMLWAELEPVMSSSPRGLQFVATALAEGMALDAPSERETIEALLDRVEEWSPCSELFSTFKSPNPVDVVRALSRRESFFDALMDRLRTECSCSQKISALVELTGDVRDLDGLRALLTDATSQVATAAAALLARAGSDDGVPTLLLAARSFRTDEQGVAAASLIGQRAEPEELEALFRDDKVGIAIKALTALSAGVRFPDRATELFNSVADVLTCNPDETAGQLLADRIVRSELPVDWQRLNGRVLAACLEAARRAERRIPALHRTARWLAHDLTDQEVTAIPDRWSTPAYLALALLEDTDPEDLALAKRLSLEDTLEFSLGLRLASKLADLGEGDAMERLISVPFDDPEKACSMARVLGAAGRRAEALALLDNLQANTRAGVGDLGETYFAIGETKKAVEVHIVAVRSGSGWAVRGLMDMGRAVELGEIASDRSLPADPRAFAVRCLGQLGAAETLLGLATDEAPKTLAMSVARELQSLGWHREADAVRTRATLPRTRDDEIAGLGALVTDPTSAPDDLVELYTNTYDDTELAAMAPLWARSDVTSEQSLAMWKHLSFKPELKDASALMARVVVRDASTEALLQAVEIAADHGLFAPAQTAMSAALAREDANCALDKMERAARAFANVVAGHAAETLQWSMSWRLGTLAQASYDVRPRVAEILLAEEPSLIDRLKILRSLREWSPNPERVNILLSDELRVNQPATSLSENSIDLLRESAQHVSDAGEKALAADWLEAVAKLALSPPWLNFSEAYQAAGRLADDGAVDRARPLIEQVAHAEAADRQTRVLAAWHMGDWHGDAASALLHRLALDNFEEGDDIEGRCDVLRALFFLKRYEEVCELAIVLWRAAEPGSDERDTCERYWGRSRWAIEQPAGGA